MLCLYSLNLARGAESLHGTSAAAASSRCCHHTRLPRYWAAIPQSRYTLSTVMAKVCVVLGSVREGRMGERVARLVRSANIFAAL